MNDFVPGKLYKLRAGLGFGYQVGKELFACETYEKGSDWGGPAIMIDKHSVLMFVKDFWFRDQDFDYDTLGNFIDHSRVIYMDVFLFGETLVQINADDSNVLEPV